MSTKSIFHNIIIKNGDEFVSALEKAENAAKEIRNLDEYNPEYRKNGTLIWKKYQKKRQRKKYPEISMKKISLKRNVDYKVDEEILEQSRQQYKQTNRMIPVYLAYDHALIAGFEQYVLAKEFGLGKIPFQYRKKTKYEGRTRRKPNRQKSIK